MKANAENINKIIKSLNTKYCISEKFIMISANVIDSRSANIISEDVSKRRYSENSKTAL